MVNQYRINGGVFVTINIGKSWRLINSEITNTIVLFLVINGTHIFAGTSSGNFLSTDNEINWSVVNSGLTSNNLNLLAICGSNILAGTEDGGVFLSTNNGNNIKSRL